MPSQCRYCSVRGYVNVGSPSLEALIVSHSSLPAGRPVLHLCSIDHGGYRWPVCLVTDAMDATGLLPHGALLASAPQRASVPEMLDLSLSRLLATQSAEGQQAKSCSPLTVNTDPRPAVRA